MQTELMRLARNAVTNALRRGDLIRPDTCSKCLNFCKPQAHHHRGYEREFWLDVLWLCKRCHTAEHYPDRPFKPLSRADYYKAYHEKHRKKRHLESAAYTAAHPKKVAAMQKRWREKNPEKVKGYWSAWSEKHSAERAEYMKQYAKRRRDEINARRRERRRIQSGQ